MMSPTALCPNHRRAVWRCVTASQLVQTVRSSVRMVRVRRSVTKALTARMDAMSWTAQWSVPPPTKFAPTSAMGMRTWPSPTRTNVPTLTTHPWIQLLMRWSLVAAPAALTKLIVPMGFTVKWVDQRAARVVLVERAAQLSSTPCAGPTAFNTTVLALPGVMALPSSTMRSARKRLSVLVTLTRWPFVRRNVEARSWPYQRAVSSQPATASPPAAQSRSLSVGMRAVFRWLPAVTV